MGTMYNTELLTILSALYAILGVVIVIGFIIWILTIIARWRIFEKAGEAGWKSIIPFYSDYIMYKFCWDVKFFWITLGISIASMIFSTMEIGFLVMLCYIALIVITVMMYNKLSISFGQGTAFTVGLVLLNTIFLLILGFGSAQYQGNSSQESIDIS
ncbi:MAG: DUF5684 domain-containing protein [Lachnospiraceae bacterium]